jgi:hypothetical protein
VQAVDADVDHRVGPVDEPPFIQIFSVSCTARAPSPLILP